MPHFVFQKVINILCVKHDTFILIQTLNVLTDDDDNNNKNNNVMFRDSFNGLKKNVL